MTADSPELDRNDAADPWAAAVLLHPHPGYGGNRFNRVVDFLFRRLPEGGVSAVRFNFSSSDVAVAARETAAAVAATAAATEAGRLFLVGYSFGADVATTVGDDRLAGWFLVAPPLSLVPVDAMVAPTDPRPKALAVPEHDQFAPPERAMAVTAGWANTTVDVVPDTGHLFARPGSVALVADQFMAWAERLR